MELTDYAKMLEFNVQDFKKTSFLNQQRWRKGGMKVRRFDFSKEAPGQQS